MEGVRRQQRERAARLRLWPSPPRAPFAAAARLQPGRVEAPSQAAGCHGGGHRHHDGGAAPLFAEPDPEPDRDGDNAADPSDAFDADADVFKIESESVAEWESDDDVPLATVNGDRRCPCSPELHQLEAADAQDTQLKKASIALERPCPTLSSPGVPTRS